MRTDVVVMGTHGRTGFSRLLLGSVAERVIAAVACPVVVVRGTKSSEKTRRVVEDVPGGTRTVQVLPVHRPSPSAQLMVEHGDSSI